MKNYRLKDVHLEKNSDWKIFVAIGCVYDESSDWVTVLNNQQAIDLLNDAIVNSTKEIKINKPQLRTSLLDFRTKL